MRWINRLSDLKQGYLSFRAKNYKEAKELYLNYLRTIELCLGVAIFDINKNMFEKFGRAEELSPFTLTLWDMVIICDKEGKPPSEEMTRYATKFVELSKDSISKQTVINSIKKYKREAVNKKIFKQLLIDLGVGGGCFVATYAFSNAYAPEVMQLREFRDHVLMKTKWGRLLVFCYYKTSPAAIYFFQTLRVPKFMLRKMTYILLKYLPKG